MRELARYLKSKGYTKFLGVPCSRLKDFLDEVGDPFYTTSEFEATMVAAGMAVGGEKTVVFLQNSGIGDILEPLASLIIPAGIPMVFVVSMRGGDSDEEHHKIMYRISKYVWPLFGKRVKVVDPEMLYGNFEVEGVTVILA